MLHALPPVPVPAPQPMPIEASPAPDLDGDGVAERFDEVPDSCGTGGCVYRVFFTSRGGDRFVGEIAGHWPFEIDRRRGKAPADVIATWRLGATESMASRYVFKRGGYVEHSESHCEGDACTAEHLVRR